VWERNTLPGTGKPNKGGEPMQTEGQLGHGVALNYGPESEKGKLLQPISRRRGKQGTIELQNPYPGGKRRESRGFEKYGQKMVTKKDTI